MPCVLQTRCASSFFYHHAAQDTLASGAVVLGLPALHTARVAKVLCGAMYTTTMPRELSKVRGQAAQRGHSKYQTTSAQAVVATLGHDQTFQQAKRAQRHAYDSPNDVIQCSMAGSEEVAALATGMRLTGLCGSSTSRPSFLATVYCWL